MKRLELITQPKPSKCRILIGENFGNLKRHCKTKEIMVVADKNLMRHHNAKLIGFNPMQMIAEEKEKTMRAVSVIHEMLARMRADRSTMLVGVGGGITSDIVGFAASTYHRGIPFAFVPTTLLGAADASVGGKNGVNFLGFKNQIGTTRQPEFCLMDFEFFNTLPQAEIKSGIAEMVKHAAIKDRELFGYLNKNSNALLRLNQDVLEHVLYASLTVKATIVEADEMETKERMKLNFGHTFGHAVESISGLAHGFAVSIGMAIEARISENIGITQRTERQKLVSLLQKFGLPVSTEINSGELFRAIKMDKKKHGSRISIPMIERIGTCGIKEISMRRLQAAFES